MQSYSTVHESPETNGARYIRKGLSWLPEDHYEPDWAEFETEIVRPEGGLPESSEMEILATSLRLLDLMNDVIFLDPNIAKILPGHSMSGWAFTHESAHEKFNRLSEEWYNASRFMSSVHQMVMLPSYQSIIGMGWPAVPLILNELKQRRRQWFWALRAITDEEPVAVADKGDVRAMTRAWLRWGQDRGIIID